MKKDPPHRRTEAHHRALAEVGGQFIWTADASGLGDEAAAWLEAFTGLARPPSGERDFWLVAVHPEDRPKLAGHPHLTGKREAVDTEFRIRNAAGEYRWVRLRGVPVRDATGAFCEWIGTLADVTPERRAEDALRKALQRLHLALEATGLGIYEHDVTSGQVDWDDRVRQLWGASPEESITYRTFLAGLHPDDRDRVDAAVSHALDPAHSGRFHGEYRVVHRRDGVTRWVAATGRVTFSEGKAIRMVGTVQDITARREAQEALRASEERFRTVIENSRDGINMLDLATGRYVFMSPAQVALTGFSEEELGNLPVEEAYARVHPEDREISIRQQQLIADGQGQAGPVEYRWKVKSGEYRWFSDSRKLVRDAQGKAVALVGVSRDITDRKRAEEALRASERALAETNAQLREEDRRKNEFLAMLSHELRNPLAPIASSLYILEHAKPGGDRARRAREVIERQVRQLTNLVDDLLDVTRITRNKVHLHRQRLELGDLVHEAVEDSRPLFERAGIDLQFVAAGGPVIVSADATRLTQVVGNLLQNSLKFTRAGGHCRASVGSEDGQAVVQVTDDGQGMDAETLERLFQPFVQADQSLDRAKGGLGLGLALVKGLVEMHGGQVTARSEGPGKGSTFEIRLALLGERTAAARPAPPVPPVASRRVLVIEDNLDAARSLSDALELCGHQVVVTSTGPEGLARAHQFRPEVVLCDIGLPGMDGYEVARAFAADEQLRGAYLVALTGYALPEDVRRASEAGFRQHIAKPPSLEQLEQLLATAPAVAPVRPPVEER